MAEKYKVNKRDFSRERPIGVSGILRCHNCADFLEACIDSCINGLDELIAVYHDCTDNTVQILYQKKEQYPRKIKIYEYKPYLFPIEMDRGTFMFAKQLPTESEHLLSGYNNYALTKVTFRYAVKVDADQVYFSQYWDRLCNAYRSTAQTTPNSIERIAFKLYRSYIRLFTKDSLSNCLLRKVTILLYPFYFSYIEKIVIRDKVSVSLSGINLCYLDDQWTVSLGLKGGKELFPLFNGVHDTFFFELSSDTFYEKWCKEGNSPGQYRILEIMKYRKEILEAGFLWFHMKPTMRYMAGQTRTLYEKYPNRFVPLHRLKIMPYKQFCRSYHPFFILFEASFSYFFYVQRKRIPWNILAFLEKQYNRNMSMDLHYDRDYYLEYQEELDKRIEQFLQHWETGNLISLGEHSLNEPLHTFLFYRLISEREHYNQCRLKNMTVDASMERVDGLLDILNNEGQKTVNRREEILTDIKEHPWNELLGEYKGLLLVYVFNDKQLDDLTPLLQKLDCPFLLLSEYDIPEHTDLPESALALTIDFSSEKIFTNPKLERMFPLVFHYTNTFDILLQILCPSKVVCLGEHHLQEHLLRLIGKSYEIPYYDIQQECSPNLRIKDLPSNKFQ